MSEGKNIINLKDYTQDELVDLMDKRGEPKFRAKQIFKWLYRGISSIDEMTDLSKSLREKLKENYYVSTLTIYKKWVSQTDGTRKYLLKLSDGNMIESVLMKYHHGNTICISSQVGCAMGCRFCASTIGGLVRNLSAGEIIDQVMTVAYESGEKISNIVMMGIGEPLANFDNVIKFLKNVNNPDGLNIGYRHISISTCGLADKIYELSKYNFPITLSISLHASENEVRSSIMPVNNRFNIETLLDACRAYTDKCGRRISFEYAMIKGVTDTPELARKLALRIKGMLCHVNLIPVNNVEERDFEKPTKESMKQFIDILEKHHIAVTVRRELGSDIAASCGQLRRNEEVNAGK